MSTGSKQRISVIIPVRNEAGKIHQCLEAVFSQSVKPHEVVIVDGHSTDGTIEEVRKFPAKIFYEDAHSIACARQIGVENAEGEYIAFTDADCVPDREWLSNLIKEFDEGIIGVGGAAKNTGDSLWEKSINLAMDTFLGGARTLQARFVKERRFVRSIGGFNSIYRKQDILKVGGFNTRLPGGEDLELNKKLSKMGKLLYTPQAVVLHHHSWTLSKFAKKMFRYAKERGMIRAWDLQVIPALVAPLLFISLIFTRWAFLSLLGLYCLLVVAMTLKLTVQGRDTRYLVSVPIVYIVEHSSYIIGFWRGMILPRRTGVKPAEEESRER